MELKPGYKRTEVGVIPEEWEVRPIGCMGEVVTGKALASNGPGQLRPYLRTKNVFDGRIDIADVLTMPMTDVQFSHFMLQPGDVLLNEGQSLELVGRCAMYRGEYPEPCAMQNQLLRFRARAGVSAAFAAHLFRFSQQRGVFSRIALQTTSIAHLGGKRFEQLQLAWPSTEAEQGAIAEVLSDVDALLDGLDRLIAKKRDIRQAAMQQLLTGKTRLPGFDGAWEPVEFGDIAAIRNAKVIASSTPAGTQCVELECIEQANGRLLGSVEAEGSSSKYSFRKGDVLFGRLRAYLRKFWLASFDGICSTEIWPLIPRDDRLCASFLHLLVQTDAFVNAAAISYGTHMPRSDWSVLSNLAVQLPPVPEQAAIAAVLADMDAELSVLEARREKTRALKQAMMQELLTGRTRLVETPTSANSIDFPARTTPTAAQRPAPKSHNWQINEAVVIAVLVKQFGSAKYPLGRKRYTKLSYLLHRHVEDVAQGYLKKAAGPYNPAVKYKGPEGIAQKNGYIQAHSNGKFSGFVAAENIDKAEAYFEKWYGAAVIAWLEQFRRKPNDELELLATVDMAVEELRRDGKRISLAAVKSIIRNHPEWEAKLERPVFSDTDIARAIQCVNELFPAPGQP